MVGFPEIAANTDSSPGRVFTAPGTKATSAQSGEAPGGKSAGATSVTSPPNISSGASVVPKTVIEDFSSKDGVSRYGTAPGRVILSGCGTCLPKNLSVDAVKERFFVRLLTQSESWLWKLVVAAYFCYIR